MLHKFTKLTYLVLLLEEKTHFYTVAFDLVVHVELVTLFPLQLINHLNLLRVNFTQVQLEVYFHHLHHKG